MPSKSFEGAIDPRTGLTGYGMQQVNPFGALGTPTPTTPGKPVRSDPWSTRGQAQAAQGPLFDPVTGLPTRPPQSPEEARDFQFRASEYARQMQEQRFGEAIETLRGGIQEQRGRRLQALSTLRYGLGLSARSSPYSMAAMMSPLLGQTAQMQAQADPYTSQLAQTQMSMQYEQPDYSYYLRPDAYGGGMGGGYGTGGPTVQPIAQQPYIGVNPAAPQAQLGAPIAPWGAIGGGQQQQYPYQVGPMIPTETPYGTIQPPATVYAAGRGNVG